jgi:hypothetical protein
MHEEIFLQWSTHYHSISKGKERKINGQDFFPNVSKDKQQQQ